MTDSKFCHPIRICLRNPDNVTAWDEVCRKGIELFGLPGDRYITDISYQYMEWIFKNPEDALMFKLKFSEISL